MIKCLIIPPIPTPIPISSQRFREEAGGVPHSNRGRYLQDTAKYSVIGEAGGEGLWSAHGEAIAALPTGSFRNSLMFRVSQSRRKATFVAELRSLAEFCNFGGTLEVMIRDRIVCGINDTAVQKRLLAEPGLTYAKAVEIAQGAETAAHRVHGSCALQSKRAVRSLVIHCNKKLSRRPLRLPHAHL